MTNAKKRTISAMLILAMLASMACLPGYAESEDKSSDETKQPTQESTAPSEGEETAESAEEEAEVFKDEVPEREESTS